MIGNLLGSIYPWMKAFHVMAVIAWMAGLFYLPRLYVYHAERGTGPGEPAQSFVIMEEKLLRVIMGPAAIASWLAGLTLVATPGIVDWGLVWPWTKGASVLAMTGFHLWLLRHRSVLASGHGMSGRHYRMLNEVPTLLMAVIVLSVIVKF